MLLCRKKKLFLLTLIMILVVSICQISSVDGVMLYNGSSYPGGSIGTCSGYNCIWRGEVGIRYSLIDDKGAQVSGTHHVDLWPFGDMKKYYYEQYQLKNDSGTTIFDFTGAYYGTQIKQDVINNPKPSLETGTYFQTSKVYDIRAVFPSISFSYARWDASSAEHMAVWLKNITSIESHADMDRLLELMGYEGDESGSSLTIAAANAGYYVQYEPIVTHGRVGSGTNNFIIAATPTEYAKYEGALSGIYSPWFSSGTTGAYISKNEGPMTLFTTGIGKGSKAMSNLLAKDANGKIYGEGVAHMWLGGMIETGPGCVPAVDWINRNYKSGTDEYRALIQKVINGTLVYKDENGVEKKIDKAYPHHENLYEKNYMKLPSKQAACTSNKIVSESCEQAIAYINSNYTVGSLEYHQAVAEVRNGTFERTVVSAKQELTTIKIDGKYDNASAYPLLVQSNYTKLNGGKASCGKPTCSDLWNGSEVYIDDCESGRSFFGDIDDEDAWLVCEIAFTDDSGKVYSSDNTGHDAVESTNGGIVGNVEYCELFCYESFETQFPTHVYNVKAGQTFVWGTETGLFGDVQITKKCSNQSYIYGMQGYRFEEWEEDYNENETEMIRFYMKKASYEIASTKITAKSYFEKYTCDWECSPCEDGVGSCWCGYTDCPVYGATATSPSTSKTYTHSYVGGVTGTVPSVSESVSGRSSRSEAESDAKEKLKTTLEGLAEGEKAKYDGNKIREAELLVKIRQCTNNLEYAYKTVVKFVFEEPINEAYGANSRMFEYNGELEVTGQYNQDNVDTSKCKTFKAYSYDCTGTGAGAKCTPKLEEVLDCSIVTWDITGRYIYSYPEEDFIWYTLKTDSTLLNEKVKDAEMSGVDDNFFYYVGFGLPTALSLTNGEYYRLKTIVTNLGDNAEIKGAQQYNRVDGHFWPITEKIANGEGYGFEYVCAYIVENEIFGYDCQYDDAGNLIYESPAYCDEKEDDDSNGSLIVIDVAYRLVTLLTPEDTIHKAFPGVNGSGRRRGDNWWGFSPTTIQEILRSDVYDTDQAMYEIMLDINAINYIREDNEKYFDSGRDPYTSFYDENNQQKVYCAVAEYEDYEQKYCASDFISSLYLQRGLNYPLRGTCLPTGNTLERAEYILANGCDTTYTYPKIKWIRGES